MPRGHRPHPRANTSIRKERVRIHLILTDDADKWDPTDSVFACHDPGTRSVSTLTPSQLARKRANDREAQRAIRARTKEHIEKLESEVARLRSISDRDQEYQRLIRRVQALEDENKALRAGVPVAPSEPYGGKAKTMSNPENLGKPDGSDY